MFTANEHNQTDEASFIILVYYLLFISNLQEIALKKEC